MPISSTSPPLRVTAFAMTRMIGTARARLDDHAGWIAARRGHVDAALDRLDADFDGLTRD